MKQIPIINRPGKFAIVDDDDFPGLSKRNWRALKSTATHEYAVTGDHATLVPMHRAVMGLVKGDGLLLDHKNGNTFDNRKENLRLATRAQNRLNAAVNCDNKTGFKGVAPAHRGCRFRAHIQINGKKHHLGYFGDPVVAARAYDEAAKRLHGEFARLNFPE